MIRRSGVVTLVVVAGTAVSISTCVVRRAVWPPNRAEQATSNATCRATLGIEVTAIPATVREQMSVPPHLVGAFVTELLPGSPAARQGLRLGDVVLQVDGKGVTGACELTQLTYGLQCGRHVHVVTWRGGQTEGLSIRPAEEQGLLTSACGQGAASACYRLAWLREAGAGVPVDTAQAVREYERACAAASADACAARGIGLTREGDASGIAWLERACTLGHGPGCAQLGYLHATATLVERNDSVAIRHYERACEAGDPNGCYNVALMYRDARGVRADMGKVLQSYEIACRGGSAPACTDLGYLYENGNGVEKDAERAFGLYRLGCDGSPCSPPNLLACVNLGRFHRDGLGGAADPSRAAAFFEDACTRSLDEGDVDPAPHQARACSLLGALYLTGKGVQRDDTKGLRYSVLGCGKGDGYGCFNAGVVHQNGQGVEIDLPKAREFYSRACGQGDAGACDAAKQVGPT